MARFASQKRHTTSIMHRFKFRLTCRAKDALFMHRAIMSSMDQVLLLCPRPLISLYVSIWASPLDLWYPRPRFRAWTGAGESGRYNAPGLPELLGGFSAYTFDAGMPWQAITSVDSGMNALTVGSSGGTRYNAFTFRASLSNAIYGASSTVMPPSINLPVILYLGIPA